jgi:hypothetical protein
MAFRAKSVVFSFLCFDSRTTGFYAWQLKTHCYYDVMQVNTWLLTARRVIPSLPVEILFYATWFVIRVLFSPYLVWDFYLTYRKAAEASGNVWHPIILTPVLQAALCAFYAMWTRDLIRRLGMKSHSL